jgi:hypothetical protein
MSENGRPSIQELVTNGTLMDEAVARAVREAVLEHARLGFPVAESRDGKVVWVSPEEILARFASGPKTDSQP